MSLGEFELIERFFKPLQCRQADVLAIGDDAAVWPGRGRQLVCTDTLVAGRHFLPDADPFDVAWKALAVNVSDLLAMGAACWGYTLALTLPRVEETWLTRFAEGLAAAQQAFGCCLLGGDTTGGDTTVVTITALGQGEESVWRRCGARPGDALALTGPIGDAALGLKALLGEADEVDTSVQCRPMPPVSLLPQLRQLDIHAAIDISDGLVQDAGHMAVASGVRLVIERARLPLSEQVRQWVERTGDWSLPLAGGEDYQLLLALPPEQATHAGLTSIGRVETGTGVMVLDESGWNVTPEQRGFAHF